MVLNLQQNFKRKDNNMKKILVLLAFILCLVSCRKPRIESAANASSTVNTTKTYNRAETLNGIPVETITPKKIYRVAGGTDLYNIIWVELNGKDYYYFDGYKAGGPVYAGD